MLMSNWILFCGNIHLCRKFSKLSVWMSWKYQWQWMAISMSVDADFFSGKFFLVFWNFLVVTLAIIFTVFMTECSLEITKLTFYGPPPQHRNSISLEYITDLWEQPLSSKSILGVAASRLTNIITESDWCSLLPPFSLPRQSGKEERERAKLTVMTCTALLHV